MPSARATSHPRSSGPRGRRRAAPRCLCSTGTRPDAGARPCRRPCRGSAGAGVRGLVASSTWPLRSLPHLAADVLALVTDALALVRLGRAHLANLGRDLADLLLVDALDDDLRGYGHLEADALRRVDDDGMRVADVELERRAP